LERAIESAPFERATVEQWRAQLSKNVAKGEREWTRVEAFLDRTEQQDGPKHIIGKDSFQWLFGEGRVQLAERGEGTGSQHAENWKRYYAAMKGLAAMIADRVTPPLDADLADAIASRALRTSDQMFERDIDFELMRDKQGGEQMSPVRSWTGEEANRAEELRREALSANRAMDRYTDDKTRFEQYTEPGGENYREIRITLDPTINRGDAYHTNHFPGDQNILAHVRVKDRIDPAGKKTLFVEEIQSDWHQAGRRAGYLTPDRLEAAQKEAIASNAEAEQSIREQIRDVEANAPRDPAFQYAHTSLLNALTHDLNGTVAHGRRLRSGEHQVPIEGVPNAPMKKTEEWAGLVVKRLLAEAVENGYSRIAWTTGEQQNRRYDLSKHVDKLEYDASDNTLTASKGGRVVHEGKYDARALPEVIGKDAADKLLAQPARLPEGIEDLRRRGEPVGVVALRYDPDSHKWLETNGTPRPRPTQEEAREYFGIDPAVYAGMTHFARESYVTEMYDRKGGAHGGITFHIRFTDGSSLGSWGSREDAERSAEDYRKRMRALPSTYKLEGQDLRVGGSGMKGFYDKILPGLFRDEAKKLGVKINVEPVKGLTQGRDLDEHDVQELGRRVRAAAPSNSEQRNIGGALQTVAQYMEDYAVDWRDAIDRIERDDGFNVTIRHGVTKALEAEEARVRTTRGEGGVPENMSVAVTPELRHAVETKGLAVWEKKAKYSAEPDLFGNTTPMEGQPPEPSPQESLFGGNAGTAASRNLAQAEQAARAELAQLEDRERAGGGSPIEQLKIARRKAELLKLVNRDKAISQDELKTRAAAEQEPERGALPPRTADTMSDAIALSSPNGRMSERAKKAATDRLAESLFGPGGATREQITGGPTPQPTERERLLRQAKRLRDLAARGMNVRKFTKEAERLEAEAARLNEKPAEGGGDLFGGGAVREPPPPYNAGASGYGHIPIPEPAGFAQQRTHIRPFELARKLKALFNPEALGPEAKGAGGTIRAENAQRFRAYVQAEAALKSLESYIEKQDNETKVRWWDAYERGIPTGDPYVDAANKVFAEVTDKRTHELMRLGRLDARRAIENYIGRFWSVDEHDPEAQTNFLRTIVGKRPFEGPKSFLKERSWENLTEGLQQIHEAKERIANGSPDAGDLHTARLRPATLNYVTSQLAKIAEMERLIGADHMLQLEQAAGRAKPVMDQTGVRPPVDGEGRPWVKIDRDGNDPAFTVFGPRTVEHWEGVDAIKYEKLKRFMDDLNVKFKRPVNIGGTRLGYAVPAWKEIVTKFGGDLGVIVHEIGHILDEGYGLGKRIEDSIGKAPTRVVQSGKQKGKTVPDYSKKGGDTAEMRQRRKTLREELRNLANLRDESLDEGVPETKDLSTSRRAYLHSNEEKMANMVDAYVTTPDRMKQVAPGIYDVFKKMVSDHPELRPLDDIKPSLTREGRQASTELPGPMIMGHWYAPADAAAVWNNHLSRGVRGNPIYDMATAPGYAATQMLLGISGFHGTVIATEGMFSDMVMAAEHAMTGNATETGRSLSHTITTPLTTAVSALSPKKTKAANLAFGAKVMQEYSLPGSQPALAPVLEAMIAGGFRGTAKSELWTGDRTQALKRAVRQALHGDTRIRQAWGASKVPLDAVFAGIELAAAPLMSKYVPLMKTAATYRAVAQRLTELPPDLAETDPDRFHREMWDIVKEMDLRFGQVIYDNHFINRFAKDIAQAMFLAPGWTFGTLDLMARGTRDVALIPKRIYDRATGKPGAKDQPMVGRSGKYWIAAVIGTMILNGILTKLATGDDPGQGKDGWKDFFAFRDGTKDAAGNWNRHTIPGYLMHDVYGWTHHPVNTFLNKLSPFFAFGARVAQNRNFYGDMLYDPDTTGVAKAKQLGKATAKEFSPLSVQNYLQGRTRGEQGVGEMSRNAFGVTPAKREFTQTKAQNMMDEYLGRRPHDVRTPQEAEQQQERRALKDSLARHQVSIPHVIRLEIAGELTPRQGQSMMTGARQGALLSRFNQLKDAQKVKVYEAGEPWERQVWRIPYLRAAARLRMSHVITAPP
jgi:hypothetical protein